MSAALICRHRLFVMILAASMIWASACSGCNETEVEEEEEGCRGPDDCPYGHECEEGVCVEASGEYCIVDEDCEEGYRCNEVTGQCVEEVEPPEPICDPDETRCSSESAVETCSSDGLAWEESECDTDRLICHEGDCLVCVPARRWCAGEFALTCAADGQSYSQENCGLDGGRCEEGICLVCEAGEFRCSTDGFTLMECNSSGSGWFTYWCQDGCNPDLLICDIPSDCTPGSPPICQGDFVMVCNEDGEYEEEQNCAAQDAVCRNGGCHDRCAEAVAANSYIGCEYWPVVLSNTQLDEKFRGEFAVVLSNPHAGTIARVNAYSHGVDDPIATVEVAGGSLEVLRLPWNALDARGDLDMETLQLRAQTQRGHTAYRLLSTVPVTAYQFNPVTSNVPSGCETNNDCTNVRPADDICENGTCLRADYTYTNDASLLLPAHILGETGSTYVAVTMPHMERYFYWRHDESEYARIAMPSFLAIVATAPGTTSVTFRSRGATAEGGDLDEFVPGEEYTMELEQFEVVQLASGPFGEPTTNTPQLFDCEGQGANRRCTDYVMREFPESDLTGSIVISDKPVALYAGADCHFVPFDEWACDHMEQQLFPFHNWGDEYVGSIAATPPNLDDGAPPAGEPVGDHWRIVAAVDGTELHFTPNVHGGITLNAGDWIGFDANRDFVVKTQGVSHPIMVTQFFMGQAAHGTDTGDPSMVLAVPTAQYRSDFAFTTTETIARNYMNVVRESGEPVVHNGQLLPADCWRLITGTTYEVCRHALPEGIHTHRVISDANIAVTVYGYDRYVSYGYPAGLDLQQTIVINPGW